MGEAQAGSIWNLSHQIAIQRLPHGRDLERTQLAELLSEAQVGHGGLVLINGEAGIGKSALVGSLIEQAAEQNLTVLTGSCYDLASIPP